MNPTALLRLRLQNQCIEPRVELTPAEVVRRMGAVQAQDYNMAKYGVGLRAPGSTAAAVEEALNQGAIIRTHVLRPTWHFVAPEDLRWMLRLSAPNIRRVASSMNRSLGLDPKLFTKANKIIAKALSGNQHLTRQELAAELRKKGIETDTQRLAHIVMEAELEAVVCSGARRGRQSTYALVDEWVPADSRRPGGEEALAELARRYFGSHGPATVSDYSWWSGLMVKDARRAVELLKDELLSETVEGQQYWFTGALSLPDKARELVLLPAFDEFLISYRDRSASVPEAEKRTTMAINGLLHPTVVVDGRVVGLWRLGAQGKEKTLTILPFANTKRLNKRKLHTAVQQYAAFMGEKITML